VSKHSRSKTDELERLLREHVGEGISDKFVDLLYWAVNPDPRSRRWLEALSNVDVYGDKSKLLELLRSGEELSPDIRYHIADLLERYELKRRRGRQQTPSYDRTPGQWALEVAVERVREDVRAGMSVPAAIDKNAATAIGGVKVDGGVLDAAYRGKLGAMRFAKRSKKH
jgi:hypothetical protein